MIGSKRAAVRWPGFLTALVVLAGAGWMAGCGDSAGSVDDDGAAGARVPAEAPAVTGESAAGAATETAAPAAEDEVVYVDVRSREEFASGHVEGAINIPHTEMPRRWQELEEYRDQPMVVYCRTGRRSATALDVLRDHGFDEARNGGGLQDLAQRGVPTTR